MLNPEWHVFTSFECAWPIGIIIIKKAIKTIVISIAAMASLTLAFFFVAACFVPYRTTTFLVNCRDRRVVHFRPPYHPYDFWFYEWGPDAGTYKSAINVSSEGRPLGVFNICPNCVCGLDHCGPYSIGPIVSYRQLTSDKIYEIQISTVGEVSGDDWICFDTAQPLWCHWVDTYLRGDKFVLFQAPPTGLKASPGNAEASLTRAPLNGVEWYNVYRATAPAKKDRRPSPIISRTLPTLTSA